MKTAIPTEVGARSGTCLQKIETSCGKHLHQQEIRNNTWYLLMETESACGESGTTVQTTA